MAQSVYVVNLRGKKEPFSLKKVYHSARRAGASHKVAKEIGQKIEKEVYAGIKTSQIYKRVQSLLDKQAPSSAIRFSLKKGMRKLGPTGFPFEKFVKEILEQHGFKVKTNQFVSGHCLGSYEIDFVAEKAQTVFIGECKYRVAGGDRIDLENALANQARFADIQNGAYFQKIKQAGRELKSLLTTNAKFTSPAVKYSRCMAVDLLGWRYPKERGLERLIEEKKLYPVTILPSLKGELLETFSNHEVMLAKEILEYSPQQLVEKLQIKPAVLNPIIQEARLLLGE